MYGEPLKFRIHHATHKDCSSNRIRVPYGAFPQTNEDISERNPTKKEKRKQTEQTQLGYPGGIDNTHHKTISTNVNEKGNSQKGRTTCERNMAGAVALPLHYRQIKFTMT